MMINGGGGGGGGGGGRGSGRGRGGGGRGRGGGHHNNQNNGVQQVPTTGFVAQVPTIFVQTPQGLVPAPQGMVMQVPPQDRRPASQGGHRRGGGQQHQQAGGFGVAPQPMMSGGFAAPPHQQQVQFGQAPGQSFGQQSNHSGGGRSRGGGHRGGFAPHQRGGGGGGRGGGLRTASAYLSYDSAYPANGGPIAHIAAEFPRVFVVDQMNRIHLVSPTAPPAIVPEDGPVTCILAAPGGWLFVGMIKNNAGHIKAYQFPEDPAGQVNVLWLQSAEVRDGQNQPAAHAGAATTMCVAGNFLVTGGRDGSVRVWSFDGASNVWGLTQTLPPSPNQPSISALCYHSVTGTLFIGSDSGFVRPFDASGAVTAPEFRAHPGPVTSMESLENGTPEWFLVTASPSDNVRFWRIGAAPEEYAPRSFPLSGVRILPCKSGGFQTLLVALQDGRMELLDLANRSNFLGFLEGHNHKNRITSVAKWSDGLLVGNEEGLVYKFRYVP